MRTKFKEHAFTVSFSIDTETFYKLQNLQDEFILDRSQLLRILINNTNTNDIAKLIKRQSKVLKDKAMLKRKVKAK